MEETTVQRILANPLYHELKRKRSQLSWGLTALMLFIYFGYILAVAFAPDALGQPISDGGVISLGLPLGIGVILSAIGLTGYYVWRANTEFDHLTQQIVRDAL